MRVAILAPLLLAACKDPAAGGTSEQSTGEPGSTSLAATTSSGTSSSSDTTPSSGASTAGTTEDVTTGGCDPTPAPAPPFPRFADGQLLLQGWEPLPNDQHAWTHADPDLLYDADEGLWKMWFSSVRATTCDEGLADDPIAIYYAESADGLAWTVAPEPALDVGAADAWDRDLVETPSVLQLPCAPAERRFALVYAGGRRDGDLIFGQPAWQLGLAFSADGRSFTRLPAADSPYADAGQPHDVAGMVLRAEDCYPTLPGVEKGVAADPDLVLRDGVVHLFFGGIGMAADLVTPLTPIAISHATSTDLITWTPSNNPVHVFEGGTAGQPTAYVDDQGLFHLWFSQDTQAELEMIPSLVFPTAGFFAATSSDGEVFTVSPTRVFSWDPQRPGEDLGLLAGPAVVRAGAADVLLYGSFSTLDPPPGSCALHRTMGVIPGVHRLNLAGL